MRALAAAALLFCGVALGGASDDAARETEFDGLQLLNGVSVGTVRFAYVEQDTKPGDGMYLCGGMTQGDALSAASTVSAALDTLPSSALSRLRLRYVVLCGRALAGGTRIGGIPVPPLNLLMLDAGDDGGYLRHRTLHELYHMAEYRGGGINDSGWNAQFTGYSNAYPSQLRRSAIGAGKPGFINAYGETFAHEERAELFAFMVLDPRGVASYLSSSGDAVLRRKIAYIADRCDQLMGMAVAVP